MKKSNVLIFTMDEFKILCDKLFDDNARIEYESGEWFWVMSEEMDENAIMDKLEVELIKGLDGLLDKIYVDTTNDVVIVSYN